MSIAQLLESDFAVYDRFSLAGHPSPGICRFDFPKREFKVAQVGAPGMKGARQTHLTTPPVKFSVEIELGNQDLDYDELDAFAAWKAVVTAPDTKTRKTIGTGRPDDAALADYERTRQRIKAADLSSSEKTARLAELDAQFNAVTVAAARANAIASTVPGIEIYHPQLAGLKPPIISVFIGGITEPQPTGGGKFLVKIDFTENLPPVADGAGGAIAGSKAGGFSPRKNAYDDANADVKAQRDALLEEFQSP